AAAEAIIEEQADRQTVEARLWQDPFAAVARSLGKPEKRSLEQRCLQRPGSSVLCRSPFRDEDKATLVIGVTLPGSPFPEETEHRRRTRYAVLAGLSRAGFAPADASRLGYFLWTLNDLGKETPPPLLIRSLDALGSGETPASAPRQQTIVPYEWLEQIPQQGQAGNRRVLVLWLKEEFFGGGAPLKKFAELRAFLFQDAQGNHGDSGLRIIGPFTSDVLRGMVNEARQFIQPPPYDKAFGQLPGETPGLENIRFYAYGASAPDNQLLGNLAAAYGSVQRFFGELGIGVSLQRTIAPDGALARGIASELRRRNVNLGAGRGDIALISERGTFYGQSLTEAVEHSLGHPRPGRRHQSPDAQGPDWIHKLTYLRGLDGQFPPESNRDRQQHQANTQEGGKALAASRFKAHSSAQNPDQPMGQAQYDYLRRISGQLLDLDQELRREKRQLRAIGVLGSDVFDKLLVLRALRPHFPETLFFTTEYDEAFTIASELPFTRNLIVSSGFGPMLHKNVQREIPPFRGSRQTSAFLATLLAAGDSTGNWELPLAFSATIGEQLLVARIFEIGRKGDVLALSGEGLPLFVPSPVPPGGRHEDCPGDLRDCSASPLIASYGSVIEGRSSADGRVLRTVADRPCGTREDTTNCGGIQPSLEQLFSRFETRSRHSLAAGLAALSVLALMMHFLGAVPRIASAAMLLIALGLAAGALATAFWEPLARFLTENGNGEPLALLAGVSIWPTVALRVLGIILALYFIWRAQERLRDNLASIAGEFSLKWPVAGNHSWRSFWRSICRGFGEFHTAARPAQAMPLKVEEIWRAYARQESVWPRFWRALSYTGVMFLAVIFVVIPIFGRPIVLARGELAANAYYWSTLVFGLLMLFLIFFVFDAACSCLRFMSKLRATQPRWPEETARLFDHRLRLQGKFVHNWIGLEFAARRTRCIGALIYYPFVLIALLIVSRSSVFASFPPDPSSLIALAIGLCVIFSCAIMLSWEAKAARDRARQSLQDVIIAAKGQSATAFAGVQGTKQGNQGDGKVPAAQLESLLQRLDQMTEGAFS
ncbi:MAG: hypothetical protein L0Y57_11435, partial [Beijerinckiaceae bacterium]|nr:hypothetical protein [Beijerinckiaceae bacterium]